MSTTSEDAPTEGDVRRPSRPTTASRLIITEKMYNSARDEVGRKIIYLLNNLNTKIQRGQACPKSEELRDGDDTKTIADYWTTVTCANGLALLKSLYKSIHTRRALLKPNDQPETIKKRQALVNIYSNFCDILKEFEAKIESKTSGNITETKKAKKLIIAISSKTLNWTRIRFRRADYSLMHQIWRRLEIINSLAPVTYDLGSPIQSDDARSAHSVPSSTSQRVILKGQHGSLAPSQVTAVTTDSDASSSDYSVWDDEEKIKELRKKKLNRRKHKTKTADPDDPNANVEADAEAPKTKSANNDSKVNVTKAVMRFTEMDYRKGGLADCKMNSDCDCYYCFPLNLPELDDEDCDPEDETDTIGVIWDIKGCSKTHKQNRLNKTPEEIHEEARFNLILKDFEKAISAAEDLTFGNMVWEIACSLYQWIHKMWGYMKSLKKNFRHRRVAPMTEEMFMESKKAEQDLSSNAMGKGDYVTVDIEGDAN